MRIIAGKYRHRLIQQPNTPLTRPTKDRIREAIFSAIGDDVLNRKVLDLFSGSGAYGLEALSRGANFVTFIDNNKDANAALKATISSLQIPLNDYQIIEQDVLVTKVITKGYSLIFIDPPYNFDSYQELINLYEQKELFSKDVIIIIESEKSLMSLFSNYHLKESRYGRTYVTKLWRKI
ncbi:MAG: 16S rRNA (guanine(966)-N(2))-methyltransferase RsmD [Erysipelotrichaceae bacterium]|jgi:16S rRNA (guanine966-N2)-methyltransferase|nr:16S rRNA (guanine(966)-N(2))-methyltransferase RsmD [Erysipelotrichaceae bacterium]